MTAEDVQNRTHFKKVQQFHTDYSPSTIVQYESSRTGLSVVVIDQEGPKVSGCFALATEVHDDSGAPHTLEHLCFMGSKTYPYKGVLDKLAIRAYSDTNAWTAVDHTAYTLDTAGWDGFAQILPIYLEHVLLPTLTDAACYTEVHHIDAEGNDAGVVYSEMQGEQNKIGQRVELELKRLLYPEGIGYRYETGGMMEQLRVLTPERIRRFHKDMYQPKNLRLVLVGSVDHMDLLKILDTFEETALEFFPAIADSFKRPWIDSDQPPRLTTSIESSVDFPEDDESMSEVSIVYEGPLYDDNIAVTALEVLLRYLSGSTASLLINTMVEKEQIASGIYYQIEIRPRMLTQFFLGGVATENMEKARDRFNELLIETLSKDLDMQYMTDCVKIRKRSAKVQAESSAEFFAEPVIYDFLFGTRDGKSLRRDLQDMADYDVVEQWDEPKWKDFLRQWLVNAPRITIYGRPSKKLAMEINEQEEARVSARKQQLGQAGLTALAEKLATANAQNGIAVPDKVRDRFEVPDPSRINFIKTDTARSGMARKLGVPKNPLQSIIEKDSSESPLFIQFEHVKSNFALVNLMMTVRDVPLQQRPLLVLFMEIFFASPMVINGKKINFEDVVMELERDTVEQAFGSARHLGSSESLGISVQVEVEEYSKAVEWLDRLIFDSIVDPERLEATVARILADIPEEKRDGETMLSAVNLMITAAPESLSRSRSTLVRAVYLKRVKKMLQKDPESLISQLQKIKKALFHPSNFRLLVIGDLHRLKNPVTTWDQLMNKFEGTKNLLDMETRYSRMSELGKKPGGSATIIPMPSIDSSYLMADAKGPHAWDDPDLPALMVANSYLNTVEGPIWVAVRGAGLAYGAKVGDSVDCGLVSLTISSSPDAFKAFMVCKQLIADIVDGTARINRFDMDGAVSSLVLSFANAESTVLRAAVMSFTRQVTRGLSKDWPKQVLAKVRAITPEQMRAAMKKYIMPVFAPETSILVATCAPVMAENLVENFTKAGFQPDTRTIKSFYDDYGFGEADEIEDDESSAEDGDEATDEDDEEHNEADSEEEQGIAS